MEPTPSEPARPPRILIVDDSLVFRDAARAALEKLGYLVVGEAATGAGAVSSAARLLPDGVLLDVWLPDATGFEVAAELVQVKPSPSVVLTSASEFPNVRSLARQSGAQGFVAKYHLAVCDLGKFWPQA